MLSDGEKLDSLLQRSNEIRGALPAPPPGENKAPKKAVHQQLTAMSTSTAVLELATAFIEGETPATAYYVFASGMRCH